MADNTTLKEKYQKLTGINVFDPEKMLQEAGEISAEEKKKMYNNLQWHIRKGLITEPRLVNGTEIGKLYADVMTELASNASISKDNVDLDNSGKTGDNNTEEIIQKTLSDVETIYNYDDEEEQEGSDSN